MHLTALKSAVSSEDCDVLGLEGLPKVNSS